MQIEEANENENENEKERNTLASTMAIIIIFENDNTKKYHKIKSVAYTYYTKTERNLRIAS